MKTCLKCPHTPPSLSSLTCLWSHLYGITSSRRPPSSFISPVRPLLSYAPPVWTCLPANPAGGISKRSPGLGLPDDDGDWARMSERASRGVLTTTRRVFLSSCGTDISLFRVKLWSCKTWHLHGSPRRSGEFKDCNSRQTDVYIALEIRKCRF